MTPDTIQEAGYRLLERRDLTPASRKGYTRVIKKFFNFLTSEGVDLQMPITELQEVYFLNFAASVLPKEAYSRGDISRLRTATHNLTAIRQWLCLLEAAHMHPAFYRKQFCARLKVMTPRAEVPQIIVDTGELERFVEFVRKLDGSSMQKEAIRQTKIKAIVFFLRDTGVRVSELVFLHKRDIDLQKMNATIYRRKEQVVISFSSETAAALQSYWEFRGDGDNSRALPAFSGRDYAQQAQKSISPRTVEHIFKQICIEAGLKNITPHAFRHVRLAEEARLRKEKRMYRNSP